MFINTRAVGTRVIGEMSFFADLYSFLIQFLYSAFLVYTLSTARGSFAVNIVLLIVTVSFSAFLLFSLASREFLPKKQARKIKHVYRIILLLFKAVSLYITVYGIHIAITEINTVSMVLAAFMVISWVFGVLFEILRFIFERYTALLTSAIIKDTDPLVNLYNKITFKKSEPREETKTDAYVSGITEEYKKELKEKKESQKARHEAEKIIRRENRRERFKELGSTLKSKIKSFLSDGKSDSESSGEDNEDE